MRAPRRNARTATQPRLLVSVASCALMLGLFAVPTSSQADPANPSDQTISAAQAQKNAVATLVGSLTARATEQQAQVDRLNGELEQAEQLVAKTRDDLQTAEDAAAAAKDNLVNANNKVADAKAAFSEFVGASYMSGPTGGVAAGLLTANNPSQLLQRDDYVRLTADNQLATVSNLDVATVQQSNADAAARGSVQKVAAAKVASEQAQQAAVAKLATAKDQQAQLNATLADTQTQLNAAQQQLADLNNQRAAYNAFQSQQAQANATQAAAARAAGNASGASAAADAAAKAARAVPGDAAAQAAAAQARADANAAAAEAQARAAAAAAEAARQRAAGKKPSGSQSSPVTNAPSTGSWSAAEGQTAVNRAKQYLGWTYAWAGGNRNGPTPGVCAGDGAWNDCNINGFDCSGLTLYGWAPYVSMPHYAASQYSVAGSQHPSLNSLMPGDLVFWSYDGTQSGIHHVAMYVGGGNVIQAPQSGDIIRITPLYQVSSGIFGATRPDT